MSKERASRNARHLTASCLLWFAALSVGFAFALLALALPSASFCAETGVPARETFRGRALSPRGESLTAADVRVDFDTERRPLLRTDARGVFTWTGPWPMLEATHADWPGHKAMVSRGRARKSPVVMRLRKVVTFRGRILTRRGRAISGARVSLEVFGYASSSSYREMESTTSARDGSYEVQLVPDNRYVLVVYAKGYVRTVTKQFHTSERCRVSQICMAPGRTVVITVLKPDGSPLPSATVCIGGKTWPDGIGKTDREGRLAMQDLPSGRLHIHVWGTDWRQDEYWYEPGASGRVVVRLRRGPAGGG